MIKHRTDFQFHCLMSFDTNQVEASTNPKKNAHTRIGCVTSNHVMIFAKEKILIPIPATMDNRKFALIAFQNAAILPVNSSFRLAPLIPFDRIDQFFVNTYNKGNRTS